MDVSVSSDLTVELKIPVDKVLSDDILFIARSLGFAAYQKKCTTFCMYKNKKVFGTYYRICISGNNLIKVFSPR